MPQYIIDGKVRDAVMQYLASRPYAEVAQAIQALAQLPEHQVGKQEEKED